MFTVSDWVAMWSVDWIGFSIATSEMSTQKRLFRRFQKFSTCKLLLKASLCLMLPSQCNWMWCPPFHGERGRHKRTSSSCSLLELPTTCQRTRDVNPVSEVRTKIGGGPYQQLSPDQCPALGPFVITNLTTSNQANFNLTYRWWGVWSYASYWPSMVLCVAK